MSSMQSPSKWRDPGRWFGWLIVAMIILIIASDQFKGSHPRLSDGFGIGVVLAVLGMLGLGLFMLFGPIVSRLGDKEDRAKLGAEILSKAIGWVILGVILAVIMGTVWLVADYRKGVALL